MWRKTSNKPVTLRLQVQVPVRYSRVFKEVTLSIPNDEFNLHASSQAGTEGYLKADLEKKGITDYIAPLFIEVMYPDDLLEQILDDAGFMFCAMEFDQFCEVTEAYSYMRDYPPEMWAKEATEGKTLCGYYEWLEYITKGYHYPWTPDVPWEITQDSTGSGPELSGK